VPEDFAVKQFVHIWLHLAEPENPGRMSVHGKEWGKLFRMDERFSDYIFAEYLHPVSIALRLAVTGGVDAVTIDGPQ